MRMPHVCDKSQRMFNLMHLDSADQVDLIVRKNSSIRHRFERRSRGLLEYRRGSQPRDLILRSLFGQATRTRRLQLADVRTLIDDSI